LDRVGRRSLTGGREAGTAQQAENRWIYSRFIAIAGQVNRAWPTIALMKLQTPSTSFSGESLRLVNRRSSNQLFPARRRACSAVTSLGDLFEGLMCACFLPSCVHHGRSLHAMYDGNHRQIDCACSYPEPESRWLNDQAEEQMMCYRNLIEKVPQHARGNEVEPKVKTPVKNPRCSGREQVGN